MGHGDEQACEQPNPRGHATDLLGGVRMRGAEGAAASFRVFRSHRHIVQLQLVAAGFSIPLTGCKLNPETISCCAAPPLPSHTTTRTTPRWFPSPPGQPIALLGVLAF